MGHLYRLKRKLEKRIEWYRRKRLKPNKDALWIFGMQKAGTSAIAGLLAHRAGKSVTIDTPLLWDPYLRQLKNNELSLASHIKKHSFDFSKEIIKEPNATYLINQIQKNFNLDQYVVIIRNPFDNIRSILNRLNIPGDKQNIELQKIHSNWRGLFKNKGKDYVRDLAEIWLETYSNDSLLNSERCLLVKYESFKADKIKSIDLLCDQLGYKKLNSIENLKNHNFQPRGNTHVNLKCFFGDENYNLINKICSKSMDKFNYL